MQGILAQRQGIDLGPPGCAFTRKRTFHPDDGVEFYQMDIPLQAGQEGTRGKNLIELAKAGRLKPVTGVWGGYQDAGDWDTLGGHLSATYDLLGLYDLNRTAFGRMKLRCRPRRCTTTCPASWTRPCGRCAVAAAAASRRRRARRLRRGLGLLPRRDQLHAQVCRRVCGRP